MTRIVAIRVTLARSGTAASDFSNSSVILLEAPLRR
jgi:hypothetical protein